jgi:hypothetical protein
MSDQIEFKEQTVSERFRGFLHPNKNVRAYIDIFYCRRGQHWVYVSQVVYTVDGRAMCPIHHKQLCSRKIHRSEAVLARINA